MNSVEIEKLKVKINEMIKIAQNGITHILEALNSYRVSSLENKDIVKYSSFLHDSISEVLYMVENTIEKIITYLSSLVQIYRKFTSTTNNIQNEKNFVDTVKDTIVNMKEKTYELRLSSNTIIAT